MRGSTVGVRANGWYRQTVRGHQIDLSLVSSTRCPSLPQRRGRRKNSTSNKDSCKPPQEHHAVKVKYKSTPLAARAPPARPEGTSWASQVLRRTVVTRGGRRCSQTAFSTLEFSFKCRRRRLVGRGPRLYCRGHLLARLNTHQIHQRRTATHAVSMVELSARLNAHTPSV